VQLRDTKRQEKIAVEESLRLFRSFNRGGRTIDEALDLVELRKAHVEAFSGAAGFRTYATRRRTRSA
jgi:hypothetical protein